MYGCAGLPDPLKNVPVQSNVTFADVRQNPERYSGVTVLWGGRIVGCRCTSDGTLLEILYLPLDRNGRPEDTDTSPGRFLVISREFLDCALYARDRIFTVIGKFRGFKEGNIDEMVYRYPLLEAEKVYLWKKEHISCREYCWCPSPWPWYGSPRWRFECIPW